MASKTEPREASRRLLEITQNLIDLCACRKSRIERLREILTDTYLLNCWATNEEVFKLAGIKLSHGIIDRMVTAQIGIICQQSGGAHYYQLQVPPSSIDWEHWRQVARDIPESNSSHPPAEEIPKPKRQKQGKLI